MVPRELAELDVHSLAKWLYGDADTPEVRGLCFCFIMNWYINRAREGMCSVEMVWEYSQLVAYHQNYIRREIFNQPARSWPLSFEPWITKKK